MIEVKDVVKTFDGFRALDGVTMTAPRRRGVTVSSAERRGQVHRSSAT
ncbi:MAG: hypothetical protein ACLSHG_09730 [Oscillospiraceae bacterium]